MAGKKGRDKSNPAELSLCLMSIMPPQLIPQTLTWCFSGRATAAHCCFAPVCNPSKSRWDFSHVWLFSALSFFTKVRFRRRRRWHLSTASAQHSAVESTTIHTWRIERSKVDRMCNLRGEEGDADFECLSEKWKTIMFYDRYPVREGRAASCLEAIHVPSKPRPDRHSSKQKDFPQAELLRAPVTLLLLWFLWISSHNKIKKTVREKAQNLRQQLLCLAKSLSQHQQSECVPSRLE